jgi:hypothetical protein
MISYSEIATKVGNGSGQRQRCSAKRHSTKRVYISGDDCAARGCRHDQQQLPFQESHFMFRFRIAAMAAVVSLTLAGAGISVAMAQTSDPGAAASSTQPPKQVKAQRKATRKADHKAARTKKDAELSTLKKNGYDATAGHNTNYPQDVQKAQRKAADANAASNP